MNQTLCVCVCVSVCVPAGTEMSIPPEAGVTDYCEPPDMESGYESSKQSQPLNLSLAPPFFLSLYIFFDPTALELTM